MELFVTDNCDISQSVHLLSWCVTSTPLSVLISEDLCVRSFTILCHHLRKFPDIWLEVTRPRTQPAPAPSCVRKYPHKLTLTEPSTCHGVYRGARRQWTQLGGWRRGVNTARRRVEERSEHCQEKGGGEESLNWLLANSYCSCSMATLKLLPGTVNSLLVELLQVLIHTNTNNIINPS